MAYQSQVAVASAAVALERAVVPSTPAGGATAPPAAVVPVPLPPQPRARNRAADRAAVAIAVRPCMRAGLLSWSLTGIRASEPLVRPSGLDLRTKWRNSAISKVRAST